MLCLFSLRYHHLDADGLPCNEDLVHARLRELDSLHSSRVQKLTGQLRKAESVVVVSNSLSRVPYTEEELPGSLSEKVSSYLMLYVIFITRSSYPVNFLNVSYNSCPVVLNMRHSTHFCWSC